jgi:predicted dehydrogenase
MASDCVRWGILGTGGIARAFARDLPRLGDAVVAAVGSRSQEGADAFAAFLDEETGTRDVRRHASYEDLVADQEVDVVYVATPHPGHHAAAALALSAGKPVLVEKPFTINAAEAEDLVSRARVANVPLLEAMWTRFLPHMAFVRDVLAAGTLGDVVTLVVDHGQWFPPDPHHRLLDPALGGGALLDLGVYPVSFASSVLGEPERITARSKPAFTGVDGTTSMIFEYASGAHALLTTTLSGRTVNAAAVNGTEARIEIDATWWAPSVVRVVSRDGTVLERYDSPPEGHGLRFEAAEMGRLIREGRLESPILPLDETLAVMRTMDEVRRQIGLRYAADET